MLMDIYICTEEAKGNAFFDIDCNSDCWDDTHIVYLCVSSLFLMLIIPVGMYIRVKL